MPDYAVLRSAVILVGLLLTGSPTLAEATDPAAGKSVFNSQCSICHSPQPGKNMIGPSLFGIIGRKTGSVSGFHYSPANQNANIVWDDASLNKYLQSPRTMIPATTMTYAGLKDDAKRGDLLGFLATLK
jgi:cytochrome c